MIGKQMQTKNINHYHDRYSRNHYHDNGSKTKKQQKIIITFLLRNLARLGGPTPTLLARLARLARLGCALHTCS